MHSPPSFTIGSSSKSLFTVIISSLDSNVVENGKNELLHYAVSNLSNDEKGQTWMDYMQPIPAKGSGYHRLVATLYHQTDRLEVEKLSGCLSGRQFDSAEYLAANQDVLTPAGFCFSQVYFREGSKKSNSSFFSVSNYINFFWVIIKSIFLGPLGRIRQRRLSRSFAHARACLCISKRYNVK